MMNKTNVKETKREHTLHPNQVDFLLNRMRRHMTLVQSHQLGYDRAHDPLMRNMTDKQRKYLHVLLNEKNYTKIREILTNLGVPKIKQ